MKEKKNNQVDFLYGAGTVILSLVLWFWMIPTQIKTRKAYFNDVAMIPRFAVIVMAIMGLLLMIISCKKVGSVKQLLDFSAFKANWKGMLKLVLFIAALVLYIKLIPIAGFVICTIPFTFGLLWCFGSKPLWKNGIIAVVFAAIAYLLFMYAFRVNLPNSPLGF